MKRRTQGNVSLAIGGLVTGYGLITLIRDTSTRRQAKRIAKKKAEEKVSDKAVTLMKFEVQDKCPCGKKVEKWERQGAPVWMADEEKWYRRCEDCDRDRVCFGGDPAEVIDIGKRQDEAV